MTNHDGDTQPLTPIERDPWETLAVAEQELKYAIAEKAARDLRRIACVLHRTLQSELALCAALGVAAGMILRGWEFFLHSGTQFQAVIGALLVGAWLWFFFSPDPGN